MIKALLATGRISNLPTVWSNILIGHLIILFGKNPPKAQLFNLNDPAFTPLLTSLTITSIAASLIYIGGCFLGDAIDSNFDKKHKPERPIPSGILNRTWIFIGALCMLTIGSVLALTPNGQFITSSQTIATLGLSFSVILYSWLHKKSLYFGLPLIGACRFFLILFGTTFSSSFFSRYTPSLTQGLSENFESEFNSVVLFTAIAIGLYTICFASVARTESSKTPFSYRNTIALIMALLPFLFICGLTYENNIKSWTEIKEITPILTELNTFPILLIAYLNYWIWFAVSLIKLKVNDKGSFVSMSLAGFCLLDATIAAIFGWPYLIITLLLFTLALLLQKIAPAT